MQLGLCKLKIKEFAFFEFFTKSFIFSLLSSEKFLKFIKIIDYADEMERCTASIEARLARNAVDDLDKGDYYSSRIKPYEGFLI